MKVSLSSFRKKERSELFPTLIFQDLLNDLCRPLPVFRADIDKFEAGIKKMAAFLLRIGFLYDPHDRAAAFDRHLSVVEIKLYIIALEETQVIVYVDTDPARADILGLRRDRLRVHALFDDDETFVICSRKFPPVNAVPHNALLLRWLNYTHALYKMQEQNINCNVSGAHV